MKEPLTPFAPSASSYDSFEKSLPPSLGDATIGDASCGDFPTCWNVIGPGDTSCAFPGCSKATTGDVGCRYGGAFDPTIVPDAQVVYPPKRTLIASPSTVETHRGDDGIYSHNPILDHDAEELWRFLLSNLNSPRLAIHVLAFHTETRTRTVTHTDDDGNTTSRIEDYTETVKDCDFRVDVSSYVLPQRSQIVAQPSRGASLVRETLEEYMSRYSRTAACGRNL